MKSEENLIFPSGPFQKIFPVFYFSLSVILVLVPSSALQAAVRSSPFASPSSLSVAAHLVSDTQKSNSSRFEPLFALSGPKQKSRALPRRPRRHTQPIQTDGLSDPVDGLVGRARIRRKSLRRSVRPAAKPSQYAHPVYRQDEALSKVSRGATQGVRTTVKRTKRVKSLRSVRRGRSRSQPESAKPLIEEFP